MGSVHLHYVYRGYDKGGELVYIGCTASLIERMDAHMRGPNGKLFHRFRVESFGSLSAARAAEKEAIYSEQPLLNAHYKCMLARDYRHELNIDDRSPDRHPEYASRLANWIKTNRMEGIARSTPESTI